MLIIFCKRLFKGVLSTTCQEATRFLYLPAVLPVIGTIERCRRTPCYPDSQIGVLWDFHSSDPNFFVS